MSDTRRDFLLRFAATALAAAAAEAKAAEMGPLQGRGPVAVYGPPPNWRNTPNDFYATAGHQVFFAADHSDLSAEAKADLDRQVEWLKRVTSYAVILEGHSDDAGTPEYNLAISQRRAEAVKSYMVAQGLPAERIVVLAYGDTRPQAAAPAKKDRAMNRRVETVLKAE